MDAERAAWVRASVALAQLRPGDEGWKPLFLEVLERFRRCQPPWWEYLSNIDQINEGGVFRFAIGATGSSRSATTARRLGKVPWLGDAYDDGWLERLEVLCCDTELAGVIAKWPAPASRVPLFVRPAPQIADEGFRILLGLPQLMGLDLESKVVKLDAALDLAHRPDLTRLGLSFRLVDEARVDAMMDCLMAMTGLRRVSLHGHALLSHGVRPCDADLLRLTALPALARLELVDCPVVTDEGIAALREAHPELVVSRR